MGFLDKLLGKAPGGGKAGGAVKGVSKDVLVEKVRQSDLFRNLPPENIEQMFQAMETVSFNAGDRIITEGDEGDYYYLLCVGQADVTRRGPDGKPQHLAMLDEPKGFGEEALISNAKRNATITMKTAGTVMRLSKDAFSDYVKEPLIEWISPVEAEKLVAGGAVWIDVREEEESRGSRLHGALQIPMPVFRKTMETLDKAKTYVCYCENGRRSSTAAFLLSQYGYKARVMRGGLAGLKRTGAA